MCHSKNHLIYRWKSVPPSNQYLAVPFPPKLSDWQSVIRCASLSQTTRVIDRDSDDPKLEWSVTANAAYGAFPAATTQIQLIFPQISHYVPYFGYKEQIVVMLKPDQTPCVLDPSERSQLLRFNCSFKDMESVPNYQERVKDLQFRYGPLLSSAYARPHFTKCL
jgi:hypothetical protein